MPIGEKIALAGMKLFPAKPEFDLSHPRQEYFRHPDFVAMSEEKKNEIYIKLVDGHIAEDQKKPFDLFFKGYALKDALRGKTVLELGCGAGGHAISCAKRWQTKEMYGIDVNEDLVKSAQLYVEKKLSSNIKFDFRSGYAESLPYEDSQFDAIITGDTIEHVRSVKETLSECRRTLKPNGKLFCVFPSFYTPVGGAHLGLVTKIPFLQWFFSPSTLNNAYNKILDQRGNEASWYRSPSSVTEGGWAAVHGGIGVNGTTFEQFKQLAGEVGFKSITYIPVPIFYVSNTAIRHPVVKRISAASIPLLKFKRLRDHLSHRLVFILTKTN